MNCARVLHLTALYFIWIEDNYRFIKLYTPFVEMSNLLFHSPMIFLDLQELHPLSSPITLFHLLTNKDHELHLSSSLNPNQFWWLMIILKNVLVLYLTDMAGSISWGKSICRLTLLTSSSRDCMKLARSLHFLETSCLAASVGRDNS